MLPASPKNSRKNLRMVKLYYEIWVDILVGAIDKNVKGWKLYTMIIFVFCQSIVFMNFIVIFELCIIHQKFYDLDFLGENWNSIPDGFKGIILYAMPFLVVNYFSIFYNNRYKELIKKYEYHQGKYFINYILISGSIGFLGILTLFLCLKPK